MKTNLLKILKAILIPLLWCRMVLMEASEACCDCDPVGFVDYTDFLASRRPATGSAEKQTLSAARVRSCHAR